MNTENREYWLSREGRQYENQQNIRRDKGYLTYGLQERWLTQLLNHLSHGGTKRLSVLDYGCGFGRMARVVAELDYVDYYGYDISGKMVEPLLASPPARYPDIHQRVGVGDSLAGAFGDRKFDVIFTVAVLIHNNPAQAKEALASMRSALAGGGTIGLIENRPVSISMLGNYWHAGCWSHDFAHTTADQMDVDVDDGILSDQGIYLLREPAHGQPRQVRVPGQNGFEPVSKGDYLQRTHQTTVQVVQGLEAEVGGGVANIGEMRDRLELYSRLEERARDALADTNKDSVDLFDGKDMAGADLERLVELLPRLVGSLEMKTDALARMSEAIGRRDRIQRALLQPFKPELERTRRVVGHAAVHERSPQGFEFDAVRDTRFMQDIDGFKRVAHVMHQEWFGIRAAAGSLPGRKLAISSSRMPDAREIEQAAQVLSANGVDRVVLHGFSQAMAAWVKGLASAGFGQIYLVWHGAPVMWVHEDERKLFFLARSTAEAGYIRRFHGMRSGTDLALGKIGWRPQLYNMPPRIAERRRKPHSPSEATALAPSWNLIHKNLSTNVLAAICSPRVEKVRVLAQDFALPRELHKKVEVLPKLDQLQMMDAMALSDVVLNASIVDCHPMVELEALAVRTPSVRGLLGLECLDDHPYVRLTQATDALNPRTVKERIEAILDVPRDEMVAMMDSYSSALIELSAQRYAEFLEL